MTDAKRIVAYALLVGVVTAGGGCASSLSSLEPIGASQKWEAAPRPRHILYVADLKADRVYVYDASASGPAQPLRWFGYQGESQTLGIAVDSAGVEYVSEGFLPSEVDVFPPGATGYLLPVARLTGLNDCIPYQSGVAVDAQDRVYTMYQQPNSGKCGLAMYAAGAKTGDSPTIFSPNTEAWGMTIDSLGNFWGAGLAPDQNVEAVTEYTGGGLLSTRVITGSRTTFGTPDNVQIDPMSGRIYALDPDPFTGVDTIAVFSANASGNAKPLRVMTLPGGYPNVTRTGGFTLFGDSMFVSETWANGGNAQIAVYAKGSSGVVSPERTIVIGPSTTNFAGFNTISTL